MNCAFFRIISPSRVPQLLVDTAEIAERAACEVLGIERERSFQGPYWITPDFLPHITPGNLLAPSTDPEMIGRCVPRIRRVLLRAWGVPSEMVDTVGHELMHAYQDRTRGEFDEAEAERFGQHLVELVGKQFDLAQYDIRSKCLHGVGEHAGDDPGLVCFLRTGNPSLLLEHDLQVLLSDAKRERVADALEVFGEVGRPKPRVCWETLFAIGRSLLQ